MIDFFKQNRVPIGGGVALILLIIVYFMYFSGDSSPTLSSTDQNSPVTTDLLVTLQSLHTIKLDDAIFSDPVFVSLNDFGVTIPPENVGRPNPFLPLSGSSGTKSGIQLPPGVH